MTLENVGFDNLNKKKHAKLLFTKNGEIEYEKEVEDFDGTTDAKFNAELDDSNMNKGTYKVYLRLYGDYLTEYDLTMLSRIFLSVKALNALVITRQPLN